MLEYGELCGSQMSTLEGRVFFSIETWRVAKEMAASREIKMSVVRTYATSGTQVVAEDYEKAAVP